MPRYRPPTPAHRSFPHDAPAFFVPYAKDLDEAESVWRATVAFAEMQGSHINKHRRIYASRYVHEGREVVDVVGDKDRYGGEEILAILRTESPGPLLICTPNRGVVRGEPIYGPADAETLDFASGSR